MPLRAAALPRVAARIAVIVLLLSFAAGTAHGHAFLLESVPADGATLARAPTTIELWFTAPVTTSLGQATLVGSDGHVVSGVRVLRSGVDVELRVRLPALRPDAYRLLWRAVSTDDLHRTGGSVVFGVRRPAARAAAAAPGAAGPGRPWRAAEAAVRGLDLAALACLLGALALLVLDPGATRRRLRR